MKALRAGKAKLAENLFGRILKNDPHDLDAQFNLALAKRLLGKRRSAIKLHEAYKLNDPKYFDNWVALGNLYAEVGLRKKAFEHYKLALKLKPRNASVLYNIAITFEEKKVFDCALTYYNKAIKQKPNYLDAILRKTFLLEERGRRREAVRFLNGVGGRRLAKSDRATVLYHRGNVLARLGRYVEAIDCYKLLRQRNPRHPTARDAAENIADLKRRLKS